MLLTIKSVTELGNVGGKVVSRLLLRSKCFKPDGIVGGTLVRRLYEHCKYVNILGKVGSVVNGLCEQYKISNFVKPSTPARFAMFFCVKYKAATLRASANKLFELSRHVGQLARIAAAKLASGMFCDLATTTTVEKRKMNRDFVKIFIGNKFEMSQN